MPLSLMGLGKPWGGEVLNPEFEILHLILTEALEEMGNRGKDHSQVQRGWPVFGPLREVSPCSQPT